MLSHVKKLTNTENKKRLISNFLSLSALRGFQFLIPLITLPYLVRTIGMENYGLVNFALSLGIYFGAIIQFGFSTTATREIARHRDNRIKLAQIYSATLTASILLAIVSTVLFALIILLFGKFSQYLYLYLFSLAFIIFQNLFPIWFFQGMERMKYITFLSIGTSCMFLISLFTFVKQQDDFVLVPLLNAISAFATFITAAIIIKIQFKVHFVLPQIEEIRSIYKNGSHAFISQFTPNLYNNSALFLLGLFTNNTLVGLYTAATKIIDAMISFAYILSSTFLPYLSRNIKKHNVFQGLMLLSGLALTILTILLAEWITRVLFGADNVEVAGYIRWLASCIFLIFANMTYGTNYLMLIGKDNIAKNIALYTSLFFFVLALFIIPLLGIYGAIAILIGARLSMTSLHYRYYRKYRNQGQN